MADIKSPSNETSMPEEEYADYIIEGARSSRSKCKTCRKAIEKDVLRLGILIEGPYGIGYLWHHLTCAAKRRIDDVEVAFEQQAWEKAKLRPSNVPSIEEMRSINKKSQLKRENSKKIPYAELDPSGRATCKHCGEIMVKGLLRVVLGREIEFGSQYRTMPITVHVACVAGEIGRVDCNTRSEGFESSIRKHSDGLTEEQIVSVLENVGELPEDVDDN